MRIVIFKKMIKYEKGDFPVYSTKLPAKDGRKLFCKVRFTSAAEDPKKCNFPLAIDVKKADANLSVQDVEVTDPETGLSHLVADRTLWVTNWNKSVIQFEDHSLDEIDWED